MYDHKKNKENLKKYREILTFKELYERKLSALFP